MQAGLKDSNVVAKVELVGTKWLIDMPQQDLQDGLIKID